MCRCYTKCNWLMCAIVALAVVCLSNSAMTLAAAQPKPPVPLRDIYTPELDTAAKSLRKHLPQTNNPNDRRDLLMKIAGLEFAMEQFKKCFVTLKTIENLHPPSDPVEKAILYQHMGTTALALRNRLRANGFYRQALEALPKNQANRELELRILQQLCSSLPSDTDPDKAIQLLNRELELSVKLKDRLLIGWAQLALSDAYQAKGDSERRSSYFEEAMLSFKNELEQHSDEHTEDVMPSDIWRLIEAGPQRVPARLWKCTDKPKAVLLCVHGLGLHSGHYHDFAMAMNARGVNVIAIDVRGFGAWASVTGRDDVDLEGAIHDVTAAARFARKMNPGIPIFLLGESMGGAIVLHASARYSDIADGVISSVPAADRYNSAETMGKFVWHVIRNRNKDYDVSSDILARVSEKERVRSDWEADRFARFKMAPTQLIAFDKFMKENVRIAATMKRPALITQGDRDQLVKADSTIRLFRALGTDDKNLVLIGNGEHLIFEAGQFSPVLVDSIMGWIAAHSPNLSDGRGTE